MDFKTVAIVQARMTSTRLPGKVLKCVLDKPLLAYQLERLSRAKSLDQILVATTTNATDDPVVDLCQKMNFTVFRGNEHDVLNRYFRAATSANATTIVRVTSDCPLHDPQILDKVVSAHFANRQQFTTNSPPADADRTYPRGMDTEVFSYEALSQAERESSDATQREHVTRFFYDNPDRFPRVLISDDIDRKNLRLTVDTPEDFELIRLILESLIPQNPSFALDDVSNLLQKHPDWLQINQQIVQKHL